jgi:hypothetical protein
MSATFKDRERAAAIGNTAALAVVLERETTAVARERVESGEEGWLASTDEAEYAQILGAFIMALIDNERTNATQRAFAIHDFNATALTNAVQQVRS